MVSHWVSIISQSEAKALMCDPDKDGIAVIMCESELENKYRALVQGKTIVESSLHLNLSEHLNSEIGLGTITNVNSAKEWLKSSFLFQRIQKNPNHYSLGKDENQTWEERVDDIVMQSVESLRNSELVSREDGSDAIICTEYGDIMSKVSDRVTLVIWPSIYSQHLVLPASKDCRSFCNTGSVLDKPTLICIDGFDSGSIGTS